MLASALVLVALVGAPASAQAYRFPTIEAHRDAWYPTAYRDQGGLTDWACSSLTYSGHRGSDFGGGSWGGMDAGRDVVAAAEGVVVDTHDGEYDRCSTADCPGGGGYGNYIKVLHPDGRATIYAHLKKWSVAVSVGEAVGCGAHLGQMGSSGYSTGPHLHFELRDRSDGRAEPFAGSCGASSSSWTDQGAHGGLPGLSCGAAPDCAPAFVLSCGDTLTTRNDDAASTSGRDAYGCSTWTYAGPERAVLVVTDRDEPVTVRLTGLSADLDLFAHSGEGCGTTGCLAGSTEGDASDEAVTVDAVAGAPFTAVVDGYNGAVSGFSLSVECDGGRPAEPGDTAADTAEPEGGGSTGAGGSGGGSGAGGGEDPDLTPEDDAGAGASGERTAAPSGCATSPGAPLWALGGLAVVGLASRRRR